MYATCLSLHWHGARHAASDRDNVRQRMGDTVTLK